MRRGLRKFRGAHASRVWATASSPPRTFLKTVLARRQNPHARRVRSPKSMKRVFITGVSAGIGLATARLLSERGDEVWGTSRDVARIPQLPRLHPVRLDLSDNVSLGESFQRALREAGHFDVVINNAGSGHFGPGEHLSTDAVHAQFQTVLFAHIEICRLALASMRTHGSGRIINVTSLAARLPVPFMAAYNAAKAAMASFVMSLQLELAGSDIRVIDLQPADIRTSFNDAVARSDGGDRRYTRTRRTCLAHGGKKHAGGAEPQTWSPGASRN